MTAPEDQANSENKTIVFTTQSNTPIQYATGDIVGDSYVLLSFLARGGMGVVFKARHLQLDRVFALKLLPPNQVSEVNWRRFEIEGRALAKLSHPNIVQIYNMGVDKKGCPYYVMELLQGQSMAEYIEGQSMPMGQFVQSFKDVCAALQLTHSKGIVHRDIKPSNLFIEESSTGSGSSYGSGIKRTKVVDFGIARLNAIEGENTQGLTRPGEVFGSPAYMSPEQTEGKAVSFPSDIYSLGCTMFAALTGHGPFRGATAIETMMAHQAEPVPQINRSDFSPSQNNACNKIIARCTEKAPEDRISSVEKIAQLLSQVSTASAGEHARENSKQNSKIDSKNDSTTSLTNESTGNSTKNSTGDSSQSARDLLREKNQTNWLMIAAVSTLIVAATIVALVTGLPSALLNQPKINPNQITNTGSKIPANKPVYSWVDETSGTKRRIFNFPKEFALGNIGPNASIQKKMKSEGNVRIGEKLYKPAIGKIIWPDDQPVSFTTGPLLRDHPEAFASFDNQAIANLAVASTTTPPAIATLAKWSNLRSLFFRACILDSNYTKGLNELKQLQSLGLIHTRFDAEALSKLDLLGQLTFFQFDQDQDHSMILKALETSEELYHLELNTIELSDSDIKSIASMPRLTLLDFHNSTLPPTALQELSKSKKLLAINLNGTTYNLDSLFYLGKSKSLRRVSLSSYKPTDPTLVRFRQQYPQINVVVAPPPKPRRRR